MSLKLEEVLRASGEPSAPPPQQLPADAEFACHVAERPALELDRDHGEQHQFHRMNLSGEGVAGEHALPSLAALAARQDDGELAPAAVQGGEPTGHPARGDLDPRASAATAAAPTEELVRRCGDGGVICATLDRRYVYHVLPDGPLSSKDILGGRLLCTRIGRQVPRKGHWRPGNATSGLRFSASVSHDIRVALLISRPSLHQGASAGAC